MSNYRRNPQFPMNFGPLVVDNFAGGGGASTGIEAAIGRSVDIAVNHDPHAVAMHQVNHPHTKHFCESVWDVEPREVTQGRPVAYAWFSPDCTHHSKARGGKPVSPRVRGLAWVVVRWAATVRPAVIALENVEEFTTWGPVIRDAKGQYKPCPKRRGNTFRSFINALRRHGYTVDWKELRACDYGAPTIRKRFFLIARCDGRPIVWPEPTHGDPESLEVKAGHRKPWRTAADIIDWSLPCPSIFLSKEEGKAQNVRRPLKENTLRRIAEGLRRFVIEHPAPYIVKVNHGYDYFRGQPLSDPLQTVTAQHGYALVEPTLAYSGTVVGCGGRAGQSRPRGLAEPTATGTTKADAAVVQAFLAKHYTGVTGSELVKPIGTITSVDHHSLVASHLVKLRGGCTGHHLGGPLHTVTTGTGHHGEVRAFLMKYYSEGGQWSHPGDPVHTVPTRERMGLVMVHGEPYQIVDIGMRMLQPHELYAAQGFPADYIHTHTAGGARINKTDQVRMCGNSVCPPLAEAITRANVPDALRLTEAA